jgi:hypothetical protein
MSSHNIESATHGTMRILELAMRRASFAYRVTWILQGRKIQPIAWLSILPTSATRYGGETDHVR